MSGLVLSDRTPTPKLEEAKLAYQPVSITLADLDTWTVRITNEYLFTSFDGHRLHWAITEDGDRDQKRNDPWLSSSRSDRLQSADITLPCSLPEQLRARFRIPAGARDRSRRSYLLGGGGPRRRQGAVRSSRRCSRRARSLRRRSWPRRKCARPRRRSRSQVTATRSAIDRSTGRLTSLRYDDREMLASDLMPNYWRAPNDPELSIPEFRATLPEPSRPWRGVGEDWAVSEIESSSIPGGVRVTVRGSVTTTMPFRPEPPHHDVASVDRLHDLRHRAGGRAVDIRAGTRHPQPAGRRDDIRAPGRVRNHRMVRPWPVGVDR